MSRLNIVTQETFAGFGGPLAIDSPRGLIKAFTGDTIITLSDGSRHVIAKELMEAIVPSQEQVPGQPVAKQGPVGEPAVLGAGVGEQGAGEQASGENGSPGDLDVL